jgi:hypothetical protein
LHFQALSFFNSAASLICTTTVFGQHLFPISSALNKKFVRSTNQPQIAPPSEWTFGRCDNKPRRELNMIAGSTKRAVH